MTFSKQYIYLYALQNLDYDINYLVPLLSCELNIDILFYAIFIKIKSYFLIKIKLV